jgi:hypothetical protein
MIDSIDLYLRVKKEDVFIICPFLEAFEGLATIRTPRPEEGPYATLKLMVSPDFRQDYEQLLTELKKRVWLERITEQN